MQEFQYKEGFRVDLGYGQEQQTRLSNREDCHRRRKVRKVKKRRAWGGMCKEEGQDSRCGWRAGTVDMFYERVTAQAELASFFKRRYL